MHDVFIEYRNLLNGISHVGWLQGRVVQSGFLQNDMHLHAFNMV
jgi:hypothetical protein